MDPSRPIPPQYTQGFVGINRIPAEAQTPMSLAHLRATQPRREQPSPFVSPPLMSPRDIQFDNRPLYTPTVTPTRFIITLDHKLQGVISTPSMERPYTSIQVPSSKDAGTSKKEPPKRKPPKSGTPKQKSSKQDPSKQDPSKQEAPKQGTPKQEVPEQIPPKQEEVTEQAPPKEEKPPEAEDETPAVPEEEPEPEPMDLSKFDIDVIMRDLNKLTDTSQKPSDSGPSMEETFEHFGEMIADILLRQAEIYDTCQLHGTDEGPMVLSADGIPVDERKLEVMTQASAKLFANVTNLSERMHEMIDKLPPLYTRYMAYFRNLEMRQGDTVTFSNTAGPETAVSKHLVRLQNELLNREQSK